MENATKVYTFLDELGINYTYMEHPAAMTMEDCKAVDAALGANLCKNLFLCNRQQTHFYLLLLPGSKPFKTKDLSAQLGVARLSFGSAAHMEQLLGVTPGSVSVMGLLFDTDRQVQLLIDEDVLAEETFGCHPCVNTASVCFPTQVLLTQILPALGYTPKIVRL